MGFRELEREAWTDPTVANTYGELFAGVADGAIEALLDAADVGRGRLLDVACGPGHVGSRAEARGASVVGLDFSRPMLRGWWRHDASRGAVQANAERLPIASGSFAAVVCNLGLLHLPSPDLALAEAARVLRPGGRTAWSVWEEGAELMRVIPTTIRELDLAPSLPPGPEFFLFSRPGVFADALRRAGLAVGPLAHARWTVDLRGPEVFWRMFVEGSGRTRAAIRALPEEPRERLRLAVFEKLERYRVGGHLAIPTSVVIGAGRRP